MTAEYETKRKSLVVAVLKSMATAVLTAAAVWRLGGAADPKLLSELVLMGLPLIMFFAAGVICLAVWAWVFGVLPVLITRRLNLKGKKAVAVILALSVLTFIDAPYSPLLTVSVLVGMIVLSGLFWALNRSAGSRWLGLFAWESGVVAMMALFSLVGPFSLSQEAMVLLCVACLVGIAVLVVPKRFVEIKPKSATENRWALAGIQGSLIASTLPLGWSLMSGNMGWGLAAVDSRLLPVAGMWVVVTALLALIAWLVQLGRVGFTCAVALVVLLWAAPATDAFLNLFRKSSQTAKNDSSPEVSTIFTPPSVIRDAKSDEEWPKDIMAFLGNNCDFRNPDNQDLLNETIHRMAEFSPSVENEPLLAGGAYAVRKHNPKYKPIEGCMPPPSRLDPRVATPASPKANDKSAIAGPFTQSSPQAPFVHRFSDFSFPSEVGCFHRDASYQYDVWGQDVSVVYFCSDSVMLTLYVYPAGSRSLEKEFAALQKEVMTASSGRELLATSGATLTQKSIPALSASYAYTGLFARKSQPLLSELLVGRLGSNFVVYRFTYPASVKESAVPAIAAFEHDYQWP